jgi:CheY-like chemotaxis protein
VLDSIVQFRPDLILMDMYMPDCNGMELAQIIRQQRCWTAFPSVPVGGKAAVHPAGYADPGH